ncbi:TD and POZ domain-containing protein 3-like isoform X2 [Convolutriloba macropyga]
MMSETLYAESEFGISREEFKWELVENELSGHQSPISNRRGWAVSDVQISRTFKTKLGFSFVMALFPNGIREDSQGSVSLYLRLITPDTDPAIAHLNSEQSATSSLNSNNSNNFNGKNNCRNWVYATFQFFMSSSSSRWIQSVSLTKPNKFETQTGQYSWGYPKFCKTSDFFHRSSWNHEAIEIKCVVEQFTDMNELKLLEKEREEKPKNLNELQQHIGELLKTGQHSDLSLKVNGEDYNLHQCVLKFRCPVLLNKILEKSRAEKETTQSEWSDVTSKDMQMLLHFIYSNEMPELQTVKECLSMIKLGKRWELEELQSYAMTNIKNVLTPDTAVDECLLHEDDKIQRMALESLSTRPRVLYEHENFNRICKDHPELVADLFDLVTDKMINSGNCYHPPSISEQDNAISTLEQTHDLI